MGREDLTIVLAGNANVGKSALFNQLTGLSQTTGNWPGKTVEFKEGFLFYRGMNIKIVDLPGIYSLDAVSPEEEVTEKYIIEKKPDVIINIIDAAHLERNLFFTFQILELGIPVVISLNQIDFAQNEGVFVNGTELEKQIGVPVVETVATRGKGIKKLIDMAIQAKDIFKKHLIEYGPEVENRIKLIEEILPINSYPSKRYNAIKLFENNNTKSFGDEIKKKAAEITKELEEIHSENISIILTNERYYVANRMARSVTTIKTPRKGFSEFLDTIFLTPVLGHITLILIILGIFGLVFNLGGFLSSILIKLFDNFKEPFLLLNIPFKNLIWYGIIEGFLNSINVVIPYIIPFYLILGYLEDSGYIARMAFITDSIMHLAGLHGKAFLSIFLGFGCNVPAVLGTRIIEERKEREIACVLATMIPCSARTIIIMGLIGAFVGIKWVFILYVFNILIILGLGKLFSVIYKSESPGLVMEVPPLRKPAFTTVIKSTWYRIKDFIVYALPMIILGTFSLEILKQANLLRYIEYVFKGFFDKVLGLPVFTIIPMIFGILRKELGIIMLQAFSGTSDLSTVLSQKQMVVYAIIILFYFPCIAVISALIKEMGLKKTILIAVFEIVFALILGSLANLALSFIPI